MKAAFFLGPEKIEIREEEKPKVEDGEVLIKVMYSAICGTDVRIYGNGHHNVKPPHILGHEFSGVIEEIGKGVKGYQVGDKVTVVTVISCGNCYFCRRGFHSICPNQRNIGYNFWGGFAEYFKMPKEGVLRGNLLLLPKEMDPLEACLIEPLSCAINGQSFLNIQFGENVLIIGSGPIGCMHVELAKNRGAGMIMLSDISQQRLELAQFVQADAYINSQEKDLKDEVMKLTDGHGADVIIVAASSNAAQEQALDIIAPRGRISLFGGLPKNKPYINFNSNIIHYKEVAVFGVFASNAYQCEEAAQLIFHRRLHTKEIITHIIGIEEIVDGINLVRSGKALKVVISMG